MKTLLAFLILGTTVEAAERPRDNGVYHHLDNGVAVTAPVIVTPPLPSFVRDLTPAEYRDYALAENSKSIAESIEQNATAEREPDRYKQVMDYSGSTQMRTGTGVGYGGFGGAGGYAGYPGLTQSGGGYGFGGYGGGYGGGARVNSMSNTFSGTRGFYTMVFKDRAYKGAPAQLLNPWCRPKD